MHNLTKIKLFKILLWATYPLAWVLVYPLVLFKKKSNGRHFFFFDRFVIGGAQRIHLHILDSIPEIPKEIYFTRFSPNDKLKEEFYSKSNSRCSDIHFWCDNLLFRLFTVHYYAFYLNRHNGAHVFSSNSTFFYDMLPFLKKELIKTELLHNFTHGKSGMEFFGLANHQYLNNRIVYDSFTLGNIKKQYKEYNIPDAYLDRIHFIEPGVSIPATMPEKSLTTRIKVLYAGRGGVQKRINLLDKVAATLIESNSPIEFHFAGSMMDELSNYVKQNAVIHGEVSSPEAMYKLYRECHVIFMTSAYEGFPMLIKEGMANGCVPVVTALEGNKMHLHHQQNSLLIDNPEYEDGVVTQGIELLHTLAANKQELVRLSANSYAYAVANFSLEVFAKKYRDFFKLS